MPLEKDAPRFAWASALLGAALALLLFGPGTGGRLAALAARCLAADAAPLLLLAEAAALLGRGLALLLLGAAFGLSLGAALRRRLAGEGPAQPVRGLGPLLLLPLALIFWGPLLSLAVAPAADGAFALALLRWVLLAGVLAAALDALRELRR